MGKSAPKFKLFPGDRVIATKDLSMGLSGVVLEGTPGEVIEPPMFGPRNWYWVVWELSGGRRIEGLHGSDELGFPIEVRKTWPRC